MPHDVVKRVGQRAYRYRVESFRDPKTKKVRSRWTYVGVEPAVEVAQACEPAISAGTSALTDGSGGVKPQPTRDRLIEAFLELAEEHPYSAITAGMVASRAGLAHGTFYRYFADKRAAFLGAIGRVREDFDRDGPSLEGEVGNVAEERFRLRAWAMFKLGKPARHAGMRRAFFEALEGDPELEARRLERRAELTARFVAYLERLVEAGVASIADCSALGSALIALVDGAMRDVVGYGLESATVDGVGDVFDRAIFMASAGSVSATDTRELSSISK